MRPFLAEGVLEAGVDEVGRGALAGPVVAAAVIWDPDLTVDVDPYVGRIRDSKLVSKNSRSEVSDYIKEHAIAWSVCFIEPNEIDRVNILNATMQAMRGALDGLEVDVDHVLVDGNVFHGYVSETTGLIPFTCVEKGDNLYTSIAAASIIAKKHRDDYMRTVLAPVHPGYDWENNVGYGSVRHMNALDELGVTAHHRTSFAPVKRALQRQDKLSRRSELRDGSD